MILKVKLFLFDIDGILSKYGTVKVDYWKIVAKRNFGIDVNKNDVYMTGKIDREILKELLEFNGVKNPDSDKRFDKAVEDLGTAMEEYLSTQDLEPVENVDKFIAKLKAEAQCIGLLTGNGRKRALAKIKNLKLEKYFAPLIGAFGDQANLRSELVGIALKDAESKTGIKFVKKDVYLVGDSVRDTWCAKEAGVKIISVATGPESFEALQKEKPDFLFRNFNKPRAMLDKILKK